MWVFVCVHKIMLLLVPYDPSHVQCTFIYCKFVYFHFVSMGVCVCMGYLSRCVCLSVSVLYPEPLIYKLLASMSGSAFSKTFLGLFCSGIW